MKRFLLILLILLSFTSYAFGIEKNVNSQQWIIFCFDETTGIEKTGDLGQITGSIWKDGAQDVIVDGNPTELAHGYYVFDLDQAETNGNNLLMDVVSSTPDIQCQGCPSAVWTTAPNFNVLDVQADVQTVLETNNLDHLMKTAVASNADMSTEVSDGTVLSNIMSKTSTTSSYTVGTDALEAIRDAIVAANPANHAATANNETGNTTPDGGTYANTATDDAGYYQTGPGAAVGGFGLNCDLTFGIGTGRVPLAVTVNGHYASAGVETIQVWAYNYMISDYVQLSNSATDFGHSVATDSTQQYAMTTDMRQVSDGEVKIRFTSTATNGVYVWNCDYVNVSSVALEAAGLTAAAIQEAVWARSDSGHDRETLGHCLQMTHAVDALIVSVTSPSQFKIDAGVGNNDAYNGQDISIMDITDLHHETRRIVDYIGADKEVFVDRAFSFTPATDDWVHILGASYSDVNVTHVETTAAKVAINTEVSDVLKTDTISELGVAVPAATPSFEDALMFLYMEKRNKTETTSSEYRITNDAETVITEADLSDDGSTFVKEEFGAVD